MDEAHDIRGGAVMSAKPRRKVLHLADYVADARRAPARVPEPAEIAHFADYASRLGAILAVTDWSGVAALATDLHRCWREGRSVFICGNGGSAGNAIHLANDFLYGIAKGAGLGMRVQALSANTSVITCLANDVGYDRVFSSQLAVQGSERDVLLVFSGSGNSPNVVRAIEQARSMDIKSYAVLGFSGGICKSLADVAIHFPIDDMQIAEDLQLVMGHMIMQWLHANPPSERRRSERRGGAGSPRR
jgi:D-sedoheptulose 7-phosphate isomerase